MKKTKYAKAGLITAMSVLLVFFLIAGTQQYYKENRQEAYLLYIGLNDKDSYEQIISTEDAKTAINDICLEYVEGYTMWDANGVWRDEWNNMTDEQTLICYFQDVEQEAVEAIIEEILPTLNQNAILVEKKMVNSRYYYGEK